LIARFVFPASKYPSPGKLKDSGKNGYLRILFSNIFDKKCQ